MRLELLHRRHPSTPSANLLQLRHAWKLGLGLLVLAIVVTGRSAGPAHTISRALASSVLPTTVPCGPIQVDPVTNTAVWTATSSPYATGSPYILPWNDPHISATDTTRQPNCLTTDAHGNIVGDDLQVAAGTKLVIDGSQGPVRIFSHGTGIVVAGGEIKTISTDKTNFVSFDAEPDVASWDGIAIHAQDPAHVGDASFSYVTIQHALTAISIDSGATSSPDSPNYGLTVANSGIGPSYFDGIDARNTPISVTGLADGKYGTVNNIGSQGINVTFDHALTVNEDLLKITGMTFGSSVPFDESTCPPAPQSCVVVGSIGNNAVVGTLLAGMGRPVVIDTNKFFRAGSFGVDLENANHPQITNNDFVCNGSGSPTPVTTCVANGTLQKFSAIYLNNVTADLLPDPAPQPSPTPCPLPPTPLPPPPPFPSAPLATAGISNNVGQENGLDAMVVSGKITSNVVWQRPFDDSNAPSGCNPPHDLGYMVANVAGTGGIEILGKKLTVGDGDVVKVEGGGITLTGGSLDASSGGVKTFTSMRDNAVGIQACPSVFVQTCLDTLPSNEWIGIDLSGATGNINNAFILFPTKGVLVTNAPSSVTEPADNNSYGLVLTGSTIGPTFSDSIATSGTTAYIAMNRLCRMDEVQKLKDGTNNPTYLQCIGPGPGDHGINADFTGAAASSSLRLLGNKIQGSTNEGIIGTGLAGLNQGTVDIESNSIDKAGAFGVRLAGAQSPKLIANVITNGGTGATTYSAMLLTGLSNANFEKFTMPVPAAPACTTSPCISWNTGFGNGMDAIAFDGSTGPLNWMSPANVTASAPLGYIVNDSLQVKGDLMLNSQDLAEVRQGSISVSGKLSATGALVTSLKQGAGNLPAGFAVVKLPTCGSVFEPLVSGVCQTPAPGDWTGLVLNGQQPNTLSSTNIRYANTGIEIDKPVSQPLSLAQTNIQEVAGTAIHSEAYLVVNGGQISNTVPSTGNGIWFDRGANIFGGTQISKTGQEGVLGTGLNTDPTTGVPVVISGTTIDNAGTYGIRLTAAGASLDGRQLTVTNNIITNSGKTAPGYPAIDLNAVTNGVFLSPTDAAIATPSIQGNAGNGNGMDAVAFSGGMAHPLTWVTSSKNGPAQALGYLLIGNLDMSGNQLTVNAGDIVKVGNGGTINLDGGRLKADDTSTSSQKIFTSLSDNKAGVVACPSVFLAAGCSTSSGYWGGIQLPAGASVALGNAALVNAAVRYAATGISISSGATLTSGSSIFGLVVSGSTIGPTQFDGIDDTKTAISITNSTITGSVHGISADLTGAPPGTGLRFSGNRFMSTSAEAILGQALAGQPVWITDNQVQQAATFGIRLLNADELVLRNNNISSSGKGVGGPYPAIYLNSVTGDFARNIRGNVGSNNAIDAIAIHGTVQMDATVSRVMQWINPTNQAATHRLGYLLDGSLTLENSDLTVNPGDVVKVLSGSITINQGVLTAGAVLPALPAVFTSFMDNQGDAGPTVCPSVFISPCTSAAPGDWGGVTINGINPSSSKSLVTNTTMRFADTAISVNAGPIGVGDTAAAGNFRLEVSGSTITDARNDGINSLDTPIKVDTTHIGSPTATSVNIGGRGIIAIFLGAANCPGAAPPCERLHLTNNTIRWTGKDGIAANGLTGQPIKVANNDVGHAGTYGIRLLGADASPTIVTNQVSMSGLAMGTSPAYPAIYLSDVKGDFNPPGMPPTTGIGGNMGAGNGLNAMVFHGTTGDLPWTTPGNSDPLLGFMADAGLTVNGTFSSTGKYNAGVLVSPGVVKVLSGGIKINGALSSTDTVFTSMKDPMAPSACGTIFVPSPCPAPTDWGGINIDASPSAFIRGSISDTSAPLRFNGQGPTLNPPDLTVKGVTLSGISGDFVVVNNAHADLSGDVFTGMGGYAVKTLGSGYATIDCSAFHGNTGGLYSGGAANQTTFSNGDLYDNPHNTGGQGTNDLNAVVDTTANYDWWGAAPPGVPAATQLPGPGKVTATNPLSSQAPKLSAPDGSITITADNSNTTLAKHFGKGRLHVVLKFSRKMNTTSAPNVYFTSDPNPANPTGPKYQLVADSTSGLQNGWDAAGTRWYGHFDLDPAVVATNGVATLETLVISNAASCVPEPSTNQLATDTSATFTVDFTGPSFGTAAAANATQIGSKSMTMNESIQPNGWSQGADTNAYFEITSVQGSYQTNPMNSIHIGAQSLGSGNSPITASASTIQAFDLSPSTSYWYRAVVRNLNGTFIGPERGPFTTNAAAAVGSLDHFVFGTFASPQGSQISVQVWAFDGNNNVKTDYPGGSGNATLSGNLSTAAQGTCGGGPPCAPVYGPITWGDGTAGKPFGRGTATVTAYIAEASRQLKVTDTSTGSTITNSSNLFTVGSSPPPATLSFTSSPVSTKAGAVSTAITLQTLDQFGNVVPVSSSPLQLVLSSDNGLSGSGGTGTFYQADGFSPLASPTIPVGTSSLSFTYKDTAASKPTLTASAVASPVTAATQKETIVPGDLNRFAFAAIGTQQAGTPFAVKVTAYDAFGNVKSDYLGPVTVTGNLSTAPTGNCSGPNTPCPPAYPGIAMPAQQDWSSVPGVGTLKNVTAYVAESNRTLTITDSSVTATSATSAAFTVTPAAAAKLVFTTPARSFKVGTVSAVITVQEQDTYSNRVTASADLALTLSSSNIASGSFFGTDGSTPLGSGAKISAGTSSFSFTYSDTVVSTPTLTAHSASVATDGTQVETVTAS